MTSGAPIDPAPPPDATKARSSPFRPPGGLSTRPVPDASLRAPIPLTIEPLPDDPSPSGRPKRPAAGRVTPERSPGTGRPGVRDESSAPARPAPWRMPGLLGRILGPPPPAPPREPARNAEARNRTKDDLPTEPLTDGEVKRVIERQIRETLGDRVRSVEVRVNGKNVLIAAQAISILAEAGRAAVARDTAGARGIPCPRRDRRLGAAQTFTVGQASA